MRALGLLLAAVVLAACSSPPVTVEFPPTVHHGEPAPAGTGRVGLRRYANSGHCWFLRSEGPGNAQHQGPAGHPRRASDSRGSPAPQPRPDGSPTSTPTPPAPSVAVPTSVTTCHVDAHRYAS